MTRNSFTALGTDKKRVRKHTDGQRLLLSVTRPYKSMAIVNETLRGSSNKEWDFCYSAVNIHARLMKSPSTLARVFGFSHVPYSTCYIVPIFVARQHKKTR